LGADEEASHKAATAAIDAAASADAMIIDLRWCDGGSPDLAMLLASRFVPEDRIVARFDALGPGGVAEAGEITVSPLPIGTYTGRVVVLIGPETVGACELLALALETIDDGTLVGAATAGAPGPRMVRQLPNGWAMAVTNLVERSGAGARITPDVLSTDPVATALELVGQRD
jgi:C-terminal processing protease CtpA/Prc